MADTESDCDGGPSRTVRNRRPTPGPSAMKTRSGPPQGSQAVEGGGGAGSAKHPGKKSVRWLNDEGQNEGDKQQGQDSRTIFGMHGPHLLVVLVVVVGIGVGVVFIVDLGELARLVERVSRLVVPGFCLALAVGRLSQHLADDRAKLRTFAMLLCACISTEAALCLSAGEALAAWVYSLVVFVAMAAVAVLSSSFSVGHVVPALTVVVVRYAAFVLFETTSLPRPWRPLLGNAFAAMGMLATNAGTVRSELMRLAGIFGIGQSSRHADVAVNHVRQQTTVDVIDADDRANRLARNRRISLPLIQKTPVGDTLNSQILTKAGSTINELLADPDVPTHVQSQLQTLSELLKVSATSLMCGRSKSISLVTFPGASVFYQLCSDLPYTISEESSFAPKRIRRHFSVAGYGQTSGLWSHKFFNPTLEPNFPEKHELNRNKDHLRNGHTSIGDGSSRIPGEDEQADSNQERFPTGKTNFALQRNSLRFSFAAKDEAFGYDSSSDVVSSHSEPEVESEAVRRLLDETVFSQWDYPIFELAFEAPDRILSKVAYKIFTELQLMSAFEIPETEFINFFQAIERGYRNNPYHNRIHATDVLHAVYYMTTQNIYGLTQVIPSDDYGPKPRMTSLQSSSSTSASTEDDVSGGGGGKMGANFLALELMAMLTAAALHDYDHPGRTNAFLIATCHPLAVLYNNRSVLENHHAAASWGLLISDPKYAWLVNLNDAEFKRFRYLVIEEILVTDLVQHFTIVTDFRNKFLSGVSAEDNFLGDSAGSQIDWTSEDHRLLVSRMVNKMADINGPCKTWDLHKQWTDRIAEEFYRQGDDERLIQASVSPYMDRNQPQLAKLQESFITHLVRPLCADMDSAGLLPSYLPEDSNSDNEEDGVASSAVVCPMTKQLSENYEEWVRLMKSENADTTEAV